MAHLPKATTAHTNRRYVMADKFQMKPLHEMEKPKQYEAEVPVTRVDTYDDGATADPDLQASIKAALAAFQD